MWEEASGTGVGCYVIESSHYWSREASISKFVHNLTAAIKARHKVRLGWIFCVKNGGGLDSASVEDQFGIQSTYFSMVLVQSKEARQPRYSWCHSAGGIAAA